MCRSSAYLAGAIDNFSTNYYLPRGTCGSLHHTLGTTKFARYYGGHAIPVLMSTATTFMLLTISYIID